MEKQRETRWEWGLNWKFWERTSGKWGLLPREQKRFWRAKRKKQNRTEGWRLRRQGRKRNSWKIKGNAEGFTSKGGGEWRKAAVAIEVEIHYSPISALHRHQQIFTEGESMRIAKERWFISAIPLRCRAFHRIKVFPFCSLLGYLLYDFVWWSCILESDYLRLKFVYRNPLLQQAWGSRFIAAAWTVLSFFGCWNSLVVWSVGIAGYLTEYHVHACRESLALHLCCIFISSSMIEPIRNR